MTLEQILAEWEVDSQIDQLELGDESVRGAKLVPKYLRYRADERLRLRKMETDLRQLKLDKSEFYVQGATKETRDLGWKLPPRGAVLKTDLPTYLDADREMVELHLKIEYQKEKVAVLEDCVRSLHDRRWVVKNIIDWRRFQSGG